MCFTHDYYVEFSATSVSTARKSRRCDWCWKPILTGEQYVRESGKFEGSFFSQACCRRCCYDTARVVAHELSEGCQWHEAWPDQEQLGDWLLEHELERTRKYDVPGWFRLDEWPHQAIEKVKTCFAGES